MAENQEGRPTRPVPVSIVVATYHRDQPLRDTLTDLLALRYPHYEVVVVDQAPAHDRDTQDALERWAAQGAVRWIQTATPGLTRARNQGIGASRRDLVIFVDDDVRIPDPDFIAHHVQLFRDHPEVMAAGGRVLEPGCEPRTVSRRIGWMGYAGARNPGFGSVFSGPADSVRGCNMAFRRQALEKVHGFDERFTGSAFREDTDVSCRLAHAKQAVWFNHTAWLYHLGAEQGGTRDQTIDVESDLILNDWRYGLFNLPCRFRRILWVSRLYGSRVIKAGFLRGQVLSRHRAFWQGFRTAWREAQASKPRR